VKRLPRVAITLALSATLGRFNIRRLCVKNVLIVEDDFSIADLLQTALEIDGYYVTRIARTVAEALKAAEQQKPDFAVVDVYLAKGGLGTDVGAHLRQVKNIGILFSTGNDRTENLTYLVGDAVMTKPYRLADVGRGLKIIDDLARFGRTQLVFPRNFRLLDPAAV
jgi:CheY-like chemotaxis protein